MTNGGTYSDRWVWKGKPNSILTDFLLPPEESAWKYWNNCEYRKWADTDSRQLVVLLHRGRTNDCRKLRGVTESHICGDVINVGGIFYWLNDCQLVQKNFASWCWLPEHVLGYHTAADISSNIARFCEDLNVICCTVRSLDCNYDDGLYHSVHSTWPHSHCQRNSKKHSLLASSVGNPDDIEPFNRQYNSHVPSATFQNTQPVTANVPPEQTKTCYWTDFKRWVLFSSDARPVHIVTTKTLSQQCNNGGSVCSHLA